MIVPFSLIEVFNDKELKFRGNIAAVVKLAEALDDKSMQMIAEDLNQPATAFIHSHPEVSDAFSIRWFAPDCEIGLCGHGSVAAVASFASGEFNNKTIPLHYPKGVIKATKHDHLSASISLDAIPVTEEIMVSPALEDALGVKVLEHYKTTNKDIVVLEDEASLQGMIPNFEKLRQLEHFGYSVTAKGDEVDFVSRTILPFVKVLEDPATGSSHAALTPFWSKRLSKQKLVAHQLSNRGGKFLCNQDANTVTLTANYTFLAEGQISITP